MTKHQIEDVEGAGAALAELLEAMGADTAPELARRELAKKIAEIGKVKKLTRRLPTQAAVTKRGAQAKALPRVLGC